MMDIHNLPMQQYSTPMLRQYAQIKKQYQDCLLFYRMGDFYELFLDDALIGAKVLNITLTSKAGGKDGKIPMAGVPYHAVDTYLAKLVKAGYKVAICEQLSPPNKKGLVERDVVRVVTPGTVMDEKSLEQKENNFIISLLIDGKTLALSAADISTGYFATTEMLFENLEQILPDELAKLHPVECILPQNLYGDTELLKLLKTERGLNIYSFAEWESFADNASKQLHKHFGVATLESFSIHDKPLATASAAALLGYLQTTQKGNISHIKKISLLNTTDHVIMDRSTMINLELFSTIREHDTKGTLLNVLDHTITAMGARLLKVWMKKPLTEKAEIEKRLDAVEDFSQNPQLRDEIREQLKHIPDIERLLSRLSVNLGNARDLSNLKIALQKILETKDLLQKTKSSLLEHQTKQISSDIGKVVNLINEYIVDEAPIAIKEGGMIKSGVSDTLDNLRNVVGNSKDWMLQFEQKEKVSTGISSLKVRFNKVFGFYIEVSKSNLSAVPNYYTRKQTLVNGERFVTEELKHHEEIILTAESTMCELEYQIFTEVLNFVLKHTTDIQNAAESIATIDCISSFSYLAEQHNYVRPKLLYSGEIRIKQARHPVVETLLENKQFVPNDVTLDNITQQLLLITGPNMAGKSVFIRQVALIVLMAHMGCYVPAQKAHVSLVDRIFVRSGASDVITSGLSTFMVEMVETAHILQNATKNSLIVMDEIGRGTSTYDGISIAWAVAEYLVNNISPSPKTLFATHYHELQALEEKYPDAIKNFHMTVANENGAPIFLHTILPGPASHSFGVAVARLAGVPQEVIENAEEMLEILENKNRSGGIYDTAPLNTDFDSTDAPLRQKQFLPERVKNEKVEGFTNFSFLDHLIAKELQHIDIANLAPLEALNKLAELKEKLKLFSENNEVLRQVD